MPSYRPSAPNGNSVPMRFERLCASQNNPPVKSITVFEEKKTVTPSFGGALQLAEHHVSRSITFGGAACLA